MEVLHDEHFLFGRLCLDADPKDRWEKDKDHFPQHCTSKRDKEQKFHFWDGAVRVLSLPSAWILGQKMTLTVTNQPAIHTGLGQKATKNKGWKLLIHWESLV